MDDKTNDLREKLAKALREVAELKVALDRAEGKIKGAPHYSVIESLAGTWLGSRGRRARIGKTALI